MQKEPIRVLQVVGRMDRGGIETMLMNLYRHIDRDKVQFDFLAHYGREAVYNDEIRAMGGRIYEMPALRDENHIYYWRIFSYLRALHRFFKEHREYKIIHGHMTNTASIYMPIAKKYGVTCRIAHSHNTRSKKGHLGKVTDLLQRSITRHATDLFACSQDAMHWFYPQEVIDSGKVRILANAVDAERFRLQPQVRRQKRQELDLGERLAIICVGRFRPEKNQIFLLDVLKEMQNLRQDVILLFAGEGPCEEDVKAKARALGLDDHIRFLGMRTDIPELLQAADAFVLSSLWEGLPVTAIEAQASGLHCVVSEGLTKEMNAIGMVKYVSLEASCTDWANALIEAATKPRLDTFDQINSAGYDINTTAPWLQEFYLRKNADTKE